VNALAIPDNQKNKVNHEMEDESAIKSAAILDNTAPVAGRIPVEQPIHSLPKVNHEAEISKGIRPDSVFRAVDSDRGDTHNRIVEPKAVAVNPVPRLSLVHPAPHGSTKPRASGSTLPKKASSTTRAHPVPRSGKPPTFTGYKWKPSGLTGWELYTRKPSVSINGKRSSTGKYLGYYSEESVRILYAATQETTDARRA